MEGKHAIVYGLLAVGNAILTQTAVELGAGHVPLPADWRWVVPIASAGLVALTALLPRVGATRTVETITVERKVTDTDPPDHPAE